MTGSGVFRFVSFRFFFFFLFSLFYFLVFFCYVFPFLFGCVTLGDGAEDPQALNEFPSQQTGLEGIQIIIVISNRHIRKRREEEGEEKEERREGKGKESETVQ